MSTPDLEPVDLERFWHDNDIALRDPFGEHIPQAAMGIFMHYETVFDELGHRFDMRRLQREPDFAHQVARAYNDRAEQIVGRRLLDEHQYDPDRQTPRIHSIAEILGCPITQDEWSEWVHPAADDPASLVRLLDRIERLDLYEAIFPPGWEAACRQRYERTGRRPVIGRHLRGPVTLAMSIYGVENLIYLILDDPPLARRFRDVLLHTILEYFRITGEVAATVVPPEPGADSGDEPGGFSFADDNCALLTRPMYESFGQPILEAVFERFAPRPQHRRFQHSDSDMGHLLEPLAATGLNAVNFGPNVRFRDIRSAMPGAVVYGTLAPFTFMSNDRAAIMAEVRRDLDEARATRGLVVATAGSINNGTRLTSLRAVMHTIQHHGRYRPLDA